MLLRNLLLTLLLLPSMAMAAPAPRQVSKKGDIVVPAGMHLMRDRTGLRWLLPDGMDVPPERGIEIKYFTTKTQPTVIGSIGEQQILSGPINAEDTVVANTAEENKSVLKRVSPQFAYLMQLEKSANIHARESSDLASLGVFGPAEMTTFKVPFIPIPKSEFEFAEISKYASPATRRLLEFTKDGQPYIRFFIHPNYVGSYEDLIKKYGIVYHYEGMTTSSPRSIILLDPSSNNPDEVHWTKVSLHKQIDGSVRINTDKKARRAIIMSEAINEVPRSAMKDYGVKFMLEPAAFQPKGKIASTIQREVPAELLHPAADELWVPAFILQNTGADAVPGINIKDMAATAGMPVVDFVREMIVRPLLHSYLSMGLLEGLPGELHTQNFYYKVKRVKNGFRPTGELYFKDNDGFRYDTELALRQGRGMKFFSRFDEPFTWGKFTNAVGLGVDGIPFMGSWYYKLIRNVNGFETLAAYMLRAIQELQPDAQMDKTSIQLLFDRVAAQEAEKITGIHLDESDFGYAADKGLNRVLDQWRTRLSGEADTRQRQDSDLQALLADEWASLAQQKRVSALRRALPKDAYYLLHVEKDGAYVIESRTPRTTVGKADPTVGFAMVESPETANGKMVYRRLGVALKRFNSSLNGAPAAAEQKPALRPQRACKDLFAVGA